MATAPPGVRVGYVTLIRGKPDYHSTSGQRFYDLQTALSDLNSDHNFFFSTTGGTRWLHLHRGRNLAAWQLYSGNDQNSVWKGPDQHHSTHNS